MSRDAPGFTSWADGQPDDWWYDYGSASERCAQLVNGVWHDVLCYGEPWVWQDACLCGGPANASAAFADDLEAIEVGTEEALRRTKAAVVVLYPIVTLVALLPTFLLLRRRTILRLRGGSAAAGDRDGAWRSHCRRAPPLAKITAATPTLDVPRRHRQSHSNT